MTTFKNLLIGGALLTGAALAQAQNQAPNPALATSSGLLGFSYAEAGVGYIDVNHSPYDAWSTGVTLNTPVQPGIDFQLDYSYSWLKHYGSIHSNDLSASGVYYLTNYGAWRPFVSPTIGYEWTRGDNRFVWAGQAGVEYQINPKVSVTGAVTYDSDFKRGNKSGAWNGDLTGHYWFTRQIGGFAGVTWFEHGDFGYAAGVSYRY